MFDHTKNYFVFFFFNFLHCKIQFSEKIPLIYATKFLRVQQVAGYEYVCTWFNSDINNGIFILIQYVPNILIIFFKFFYVP